MKEFQELALNLEQADLEKERAILGLLMRRIEVMIRGSEQVDEIFKSHALYRLKEFEFLANACFDPKSSSEQV